MGIHPLILLLEPTGWSKGWLVKLLDLTISRFLEADTGCVEFGCSYVKLGSPPDEVYCFKPGSYQVHVEDECPVEATGKCNITESRQ